MLSPLDGTIESIDVFGRESDGLFFRNGQYPQGRIPIGIQVRCAVNLEYTGFAGTDPVHPPNGALWFPL